MYIGREAWRLRDGKDEVGQAPYNPAIILKMLLLSYLWNVSERMVEELANDSLSIGLFLGFGADEKAPDHSTLTWFKNRLRLDAGLPPRCAEECPSGGGAITFGDLEDPESQVSRLINSGEARPLLLGGVKNVKVYNVPSPNEGDWDKLETNEAFLNALDIKKGRPA